MSLFFTVAPTCHRLWTDPSGEIKGHPPHPGNYLASTMYRGTSRKAGTVPAEVRHSVATPVLLPSTAGLWGCSLLHLLLFSSSRTEENVLHGSQIHHLNHLVPLRKMSEREHVLKKCFLKLQEKPSQRKLKDKLQNWHVFSKNPRETDDRHK